MNNFPRGTLELLVAIRQNRAPANDVANWAICALEDGYDTPALRLAASFHRDELASDAEPYVWRALGELGITPPSGEELLRAYADELALGILAGTREPMDTVELVHHRVITPLNHPDDLMDWCYIWEGNNPEDLSTNVHELGADDYAALVRRCAQRHLLKRENPPHDVDRA